MTRSSSEEAIEISGLSSRKRSTAKSIFFKTETFEGHIPLSQVAKELEGQLVDPENFNDDMQHITLWLSPWIVSKKDGLDGVTSKPPQPCPHCGQDVNRPPEQRDIAHA